MSQLSMTDDGDIYIEANKFKLVDGKAEIRQRLIQNLSTFFQEWFLDTQLGVPYHSVVFEKGTPTSVIEAIFKDEITKVQGVTNLTRFDPLDFEAGNRNLSLNFDVDTIFGSLTIEELLP